jgi:hypothetical protein
VAVISSLLGIYFKAEEFIQSHITVHLGKQTVGPPTLHLYDGQAVQPVQEKKKGEASVISYVGTYKVCLHETRICVE